MVGYSIRIGYVGFEQHGVDTQRLGIRQGFRGCLLIVCIIDCHASACPCKGQTRRPADAAGPASNKCSFALEFFGAHLIVIPGY